MASGRLVVGTANPRLAEFVIDGVTGILVRPGDVDAMANAIADLLADPERALQWARPQPSTFVADSPAGIMARRLAANASSV
jgi:glycosyltransferase involved in cell wall biosynthesis